MDESIKTSTNFDPYGVLERLGLSHLGLKGYVPVCHTCMGTRGALVAEHIRAALDMRGLCGLLASYQGYCFNENPCAKHSTRACWVCGARATRLHQGECYRDTYACESHYDVDPTV